MGQNSKIKQWIPMLIVGAVNPSFRGYQLRPRWSVSDPRVIETWCSSIKVLDTYLYLDKPEPRLANVWGMARIPIFHDLARVLWLGLGW